MTNFYKNWTLVKNDEHKSVFVKGELVTVVEKYAPHFSCEVWLSKIHLASLIADSEKELLSKVDSMVSMIHGQLAQSLGKISVR